LSPHIEEVDWYVFVLVACDVSVFQSDFTDGELLSYFMDNIVMGLFRGMDER
jgi:sorbitol-specific phosphotransferase system component IIC